MCAPGSADGVQGTIFTLCTRGKGCASFVSSLSGISPCQFFCFSKSVLLNAKLTSEKKEDERRRCWDWTAVPAGRGKPTRRWHARCSSAGDWILAGWQRYNGGCSSVAACSTSVNCFLLLAIFPFSMRSRYTPTCLRAVEVRRKPQQQICALAR